MNPWKRLQSRIFRIKYKVNQLIHRLEAFEENLEVILMVTKDDPDSAQRLFNDAAQEVHIELLEFLCLLRRFDDGQYTDLMLQLEKVDRDARPASPWDSTNEQAQRLMHDIEQLKKAA